MHYKDERAEHFWASEDWWRLGSIPLMPLRGLPIACAMPSVLFALLSVNLCGATIEYQVTSLGQPDEYAYSYFLTGITFGLYEGVDIQFNAGLYGALSGGATGSGFTFELLQPNNPPGAYGDYISWATVDNPSLTGPFTVDFMYLGPGQPGAQPFNIEQFDQSGDLTGTLGSGETSPLGTSVPEPATLPLYLSGLACLVFLGAVLRHRSARAVKGHRTVVT